MRAKGTTQVLLRRKGLGRPAGGIGSGGNDLGASNLGGLNIKK